MFDKCYVICKNCQARNPLTNDFCNECGEKLVKNSDSSNGLVTIFQDTDNDEQFVGSGSKLTPDNKDGETADSNQKQSSDEPQKRFCHNCGKEVISIAKFCPSCGVKLNDTNTQDEDTDKNDASTSNTQSYASSTSVDSHSQTSKSLKTIILFSILFIVAVGGYSVYKHLTYLPKGLTDSDQIMEYGGQVLTDNVFAYAEYFPKLKTNGEYYIYLYKNKRTGKYVFPVKDTNDNSKHYCYLFKVGSTKHLVDIKNVHWWGAINRPGIKITGDNPYEIEYEMNFQYYNENIKNFTIWQQENNYY